MTAGKLGHDREIGSLAQVKDDLVEIATYLDLVFGDVGHLSNQNPLQIAQLACPLQVKEHPVDSVEVLIDVFEKEKATIHRRLVVGTDEIRQDRQVAPHHWSSSLTGAQHS